MRVLLAEDDPMIGSAVRSGLCEAGFSVDWVTDGRAAELALLEASHDVAVLDLGLPRQDGLKALSLARARGVRTPVLIATARDAVPDRIAGLNAGADDYVLKPFDLDELVARIRAVWRRHAGSASPVLVSGDIALDPARHAVTRAGRPVELSPREFAVLEALLRSPGAVLSRRKLEETVYGWGEEVSSNAIEVHVHHLRRKLGADAIRNVRGVGYRIG